MKGSVAVMRKLLHASYRSNTIPCNKVLSKYNKFGKV
jgi:hypothetical protein